MQEDSEVSRGSTGRDRHRRGSARFTNTRSGERVIVDDSQLLIIDQFMIGNPQFYERAQRALAEKNFEQLCSIVEEFGGALLPLAPGEYRVLRNPVASLMLLLPNDSVELSEADDAGISEDEVADRKVNEFRAQAVCDGKVFVDTRCLVMCSVNLLKTIAPDYRALRLRRAEKAGRDLLRQNGAAVRYGFNNRGDELGVYRLAEGVYGLWPDVIDY